MSQFLNRANISSTFYGEFKAVSALSGNELSKVAAFVAEVASREEVDSELLADLRAGVSVSPEAFEQVAKIALFLGAQFRSAAGVLKKVEDLRASAQLLLDDPKDVEAFVSVLKGALERTREITLASQRDTYLRCGNPRIVGTYVTADLRPVFEKSSDEGQELSPLDWLPLVTLELVGELNGIKENHLFIADQKALGKLIDSLQKGLRKMEWLEKIKSSIPPSGVLDRGERR